ncbi:MAG: hypothetical protein ACJAR2_003337 [Ilumatobacter sp.]|jgi:hypothetical protein
MCKATAVSARAIASVGYVRRRGQDAPLFDRSGLRFGCVSPLESYIAAWHRHDVAGIVGSVTESCRVVECYGPVYVGRSRVEQWERAWFAAGGVVHDWVITDLFGADDREAAEWSFEYTWKGSRSRFQGCSVATIHARETDVLHEYRGALDTYEWHGTWRD